jgi:hypothetical protein
MRDELGRMPKKEGIDHVFFLARVKVYYLIGMKKGLR